MTTTQIRQNDFMMHNGILPVKIREIRDKYLKPHEWHKHGTSILWDAEAADRAARGMGLKWPKPINDDNKPALEPVAQESERETEPEPTPAPVAIEETDDGRTISLRVIGVANNPRFVYANLNGNKVSVACPSKYSRKLKGKTIKATTTIIDGITFYEIKL